MDMDSTPTTRTTRASEAKTTPMSWDKVNWTDELRRAHGSMDRLVEWLQENKAVRTDGDMKGWQLELWPENKPKPRRMPMFVAKIGGSKGSKEECFLVKIIPCVDRLPRVGNANDGRRSTQAAWEELILTRIAGEAGVGARLYDAFFTRGASPPLEPSAEATKPPLKPYKIWMPPSDKEFLQFLQNCQTTQPESKAKGGSKGGSKGDEAPLVPSFLVMVLEYLPAQTLRSYLQSRTRFSKEFVAWVYETTAERLECLHRLGIIHNDVHAENVMINVEQKKLWIIDYGFSFLSRRKVDQKGVDAEDLKDLFAD